MHASRSSYKMELQNHIHGSKKVEMKFVLAVIKGKELKLESFIILPTYLHVTNAEGKPLPTE